MFDICWNCGELTPKKVVEKTDEHAIAVCPDCGYEHLCQYLPLFVVTGASGAGKSTMHYEFVRKAITGGDDVTDSVVPLDSDMLWDAGSNMEDEAYRDLYLRLCVNLHQSGRPVLLFGAGMNPANLESSARRRYFPAIHYLALVADDADLTERLRGRPDWRESHTEEYIDNHLSYNQTLKDAEFVPEGVPYKTLNTSKLTIGECVTTIRQWLRIVLDSY